MCSMQAPPRSCFVTVSNPVKITNENWRDAARSQKDERNKQCGLPADGMEIGQEAAFAGLGGGIVNADRLDF